MTFLGRPSISSTVMLFDIGVYFVVVGSIASIALALEDREDA